MYVKRVYGGGMSDKGVFNSAREICDRFGGQRPLARWLGHDNPTTVSGWVKRTRVPLDQIPQVMDAAQRAGVRVELEDFFRGRLKLPRKRRK